MMTQDQINTLPRELTELKQWTFWKVDKKADGKTTKPPCNKDGYPHDCTLSKSLLAFDPALKTFLAVKSKGKVAGIGFVFNENGISGIDIDHCIDEAGNLTEEARKIIDRLDSYTEISPSKTGIHILVKGTIPESERSEGGYLGGKSGAFEAYSSGRYFTVTGNLFEGKAKIENRQNELEWFWKTFVKSKPKDDSLSREQHPLGQSSGPLSDDDILKIISKAKNSAEIQDLMNNQNKSEDLPKLVNRLAFYTKDSSQLERIIRTGCKARDKWNEIRGKENFLVYEIKRLLKNYSGGNYESKIISQKGDSVTKASLVAKTPAPFWYEGADRNGKPALHIDAKKLLDFLEKNGFCKRYVDDQQSILLRISQNTIEETTPEKAADFAHKYILSLPNQITANFQQYDLIKKCFSPNFPYFTEKQLKKFLPTELTFHRDDKDRAFFYYENGVIEVTKSGRALTQYPQIKGAIWKRWVLNRKYVVPTSPNDPSDFEKFIQLVCKGDKRRSMALMTAMGYLIHRYKNPALTKAIILVDEKISEIPEGRSGKSLLAKALGKFRNLTTIDGKDFDFDSRFAFQDVSYDTELVCFDDVKKNFDFERLFHKITDGLEVERKGQHRFKIAREDSAKFIITTNFMVMGEGGSSEGRRAEYELHPHFTREHTPKDEFKKLFFDEWDTEEWARFDAFMLDCVQLFLAQGLLTADPVNIARRKIIQATCQEFLSWADSFFQGETGNLNENAMIWHSKKALFDSFLASSEDHKHEEEKGKFKRNTFSRWLSNYCLQSKIKIEDKVQWVVGNPERGFTFSIGARSA